MGLCHERGGYRPGSFKVPTLVPLPQPARFNTAVDNSFVLAGLPRKKRPNTTPQSPDLSSILLHLTPTQQRLLLTTIFATSMALSLAIDTKVAHASTTNCGRDWFNACLCNGQVVNGDIYCPLDGQQTQKTTLPSPQSEQRTGFNREVGGSTAFALGGLGAIILAAVVLKIVSDLNHDMPN